LLYNGPPDEDGHCGKNRPNHDGLGNRTTQYIYYYNNYFYGTDYEFDGTYYKLAGEVTASRWNNDTYPNLIGKYTCFSTDPDYRCSTLYLIDDFYNSNNAYVIPITSTYYYSIGRSSFNSSSSYIGNVGFMYNNNNGSGTNSKTASASPVSYSYVYNYNYYYGDGIVYEDNKYRLTGTVGLKEDFPNGDITGKYTFYSTSPTTSTNYVYRIIRPDGLYYNYAVYLSGGETTDSESQKIYFGSELTCNTSNECYLGGDIISIYKYDWMRLYSDVPLGYYTCRNSSTTCSSPSQVYSINSTSYYTVYVGYYKFGESFRYNENTGTYTLIGDSENISDWYNRYQNVAYYRYTCFNTTGTCTGSIYYVYYATNGSLNYLTLQNGRRLDEALYEMGVEPDGFDIDEYEAIHGEYTLNRYDSNVKKALDNYYRRNLIAFTDLLEDNVYCNRREVKNYNFYDPYSYEFSNSSLSFIDNYANTDLSCDRIKNQFSTSNEEAQLTYPIGLITMPEIYLANNITGVENNTSTYSTTYTYTGNNTWTMTPSYYGGTAYIRTSSSTYSASSTLYVRPVITLKPGTRYNEGNGSYDSPYVIDVTEATPPEENP
jgi:hypothetical protein